MANLSTNRPVDRQGLGRPPGDVSRSFLQTVLDALPHSVLVIDLDFRIILANRAAQGLASCRNLETECVTCFQYAHHREVPCSGADEPCPLRDVIRTKGPVRVYHTHFDADGKRLYMAIDAAPVLDDAGEVVQVIETCRDVTERTLSRRILRIGNRHMELSPLLEDFTAELKNYTSCEVVGIRLRTELGGRACYANAGFEHEFPKAHSPLCAEGDLCICTKILQWEEEAKLQPNTKGGSIHIACTCEFIAALSGVFSALSGDGTDVSEHYRQCGCNSIALIPIVFGGRVLGVLHVADPRSRAISAELVESLEALSMELGAAIQRVLAEEALRAARDELESRVERRTAELTKTNRALQEEIVERTRLEREILQIGSKEQQRIGQELHDGVGQELTGLSYLAQSLYQKLQEREPEDAETAAELAHGIPRVLGDVRGIVKGLIPLEVSANDLQSALRLLTANVEKQTGVPCRFEGSPSTHVRDDYTAIQLFRIAQEAINNAVKHGCPEQILVSFKSEERRIQLRVQDDGVGIQADADRTAGCGLRIMRYRARAIGGSFSIQRRPAGGTQVACTVSTPDDGANSTEEPDS